MNEYNKIVQQKAEQLVRSGEFDTVAEAWEEAVTICHETDAFEVLNVYEEEEEEGEE